MRHCEKHSRYFVRFTLIFTMVFMFGCIVGERSRSQLQYSISTATDKDRPIQQDALSRDLEIPAAAMKGSPETDTAPPILYSDQWLSQIPLPGIVNTAGAEDSPFISLDGRTLYFFFKYSMV